MINRPGPIFFDIVDVEQMKRYLHSAEGEGTVDELGFGKLYLELSNDLFPWCSTLTTRARYFFWSAAILMLASESTALKFGGVNSNASEENAKIRKFFKDQVRYYESFLGLALYCKEYEQRTGSGIFGKRNIKTRENYPVNAIKNKGILSMENRYPNAIYRNSLTILGLFDSTPAISNSTIIKSQIDRLNHDEGDIFSSRWREICLPAKKEIQSIFGFFTKNSFSPFHQTQNAAKEFLSKSQFNGFNLTKLEKTFLKNQIYNITPYLHDIDWDAVSKSGIITLKELAENITNKEYQEKLFYADHIDSITSPFRTIYFKMKEGIKFDFLNYRFPSHLNFNSWLKVYKNTMTKDLYSGVDEIRFMDEWVSILTKAKGRLTPALIEQIGRRATDVVTERGKMPPHLKPPNDKQPNAFEEADIIESSFRLNNATTILRDIHE